MVHVTSPSWAYLWCYERRSKTNYAVRNPTRSQKVFQFHLDYTAPLAGASVPVILDMNVDGVLEVTAELLGLLLCQRVACDNCRNISEALVGTRIPQVIPSKACSTLMASFALVSK